MKNKLIQILSEQRMIDELDTYAKKHDLSRAWVVRAAITEYLQKRG